MGAGLDRRLTALARAVALWVATVAGAAGLALLLVHLAPGDAIDLIPDGEALRPRLEVAFDLDRPLLERWARSLGRVLVGDLGTSIAWRPGADVLEVVRGPALRSLAWATGALALGLAQALALAAWTAGRPSWVRGAVRLLSVAPIFLLAHLAVSGINELTFAAIGGGWIDRPAWFALPDQASHLRTALAVALLALGSGSLTELHLELEAELLRLRTSGFVDAARARGAPTLPHLAWNLAPALATAAASRAAWTLGGLVVLERVLLLPGAGAAFWQAALLRDHPVAVGIAVLAAAAVATARLAADLVRLAVDPRLRDLEAS